GPRWQRAAARADRGRRRRRRADRRHGPDLSPIASPTAPVGSGVTGNTADSGSVIRGSIPLSPARRCATLLAWWAARRLGVTQHGPFVYWPRTPPSQGGGTGSNP